MPASWPQAVATAVVPQAERVQRAPAKTEIAPLTAIRGVAALWVVAYHLSGNIWMPGFHLHPPPIATDLLNGGAYCVDIFFVLSGYILAHSYARNFDARHFFINRFARVFPLHIVVFTAVAAEFLAIRHEQILHGLGLAHFAGMLVFYYSLTFVWFNLPVLWGTPTWSLSAEFFAYFLFPWLRRLAKGRSLHPGAWLLAALIVAEGVLIAKAGLACTGLAALARASLGLALGCALFYVRLPRPLPPFLPDAAALTLVTVIGAGFPCLAVLPTSILIRCLADPARSVTHGVLNHQSAVWLGRISYSIYLVHAPLLVAAQMLLFGTRILAGLNGFVFTGVYLAAVLGISAVTYHMIEVPARRFLRARLESRSAPATLAVRQGAA